MNKNQELKAFKRFLKGEHAWSVFMHNYNQEYISLISLQTHGMKRHSNDLKRHFLIAFFKEINAREWINFAFEWALTPQGYEFWRILHDRWRKSMDLTK